MGEELSGDETFNREVRKRALPKLLNENSKRSCVETWLEGAVSQPSPRQGASSTPSLASQAPATLSPLPLSPLSSNVIHNSRPSIRETKKTNCIGSPSLDVFSQLPPSQRVVQVDVDDTFDKLLAGNKHKKPAPASLLAEEQASGTPIFSQQLFSPLNDTPPPLLSPTTSKSILESVCSPLPEPSPSSHKKKTRQFMSEQLAKQVEASRADLPKRKARKAGKQVTFIEETDVDKSKDWERADEVARELETAPHVDQVKGITPTGGKKKKKYSPLSFVDKDTNSENAKDAAEPSNRGDEPIVAPVEGIDSVLNSTKAISSMDIDRVSETDSQATIPSANQETATALTDSIPSLISNSQSTNLDQQVRVLSSTPEHNLLEIYFYR